MDLSLIKAAKTGNLEKVKRLIQRYSTLLRSQDGLGYTPLHWACEKGHVAVAACLLTHGAPIDQVDSEGWTALLIACLKGHLPLVELLLGMGANPTLPTTRGYWTPLMMTTQCTILSKAEIILNRLLQHPKVLATIDRGDAGGQTALWQASLEGHGAVVRRLLLAGANPTITDDGGTSPVDAARHAQRKECVVLLEDHERHYLLTKARHLWDASHDDDISQALLANQSSSSSTSATSISTVVGGEGPRVKPLPVYLEERAEKGEPLPNVEFASGAGGAGGGVEGDRPMKDVFEGLLVRAVLEHVVCGGLKGELFLELTEGMMGKTG